MNGTLEYSDIVEALAKRYEDRIVAILNRIRDVLIPYRYDVTEPRDMSCDDFEWDIVISGDAHATIYVQIEIAEAVSFGDRDSDEPPAINFALRVIEEGGLIVGGAIPYNYTEQCWVEALDTDAVETRFKILEGIHERDMIPLLADWFTR